ncbi:SDR family NAD(P)-dependent oxidoreductase [Pseudomonas typographi]|uniref:SDR family NAD(P)-dependent oxidoreductase n=1 Tax=Pseudomonas typographi TaxID=2715964 RepID=UPI00168294B2|nr:SDR family oxidoreductase [Pseudomonas typographi]MBD1586610.1 SDR family oxidoreductase [Pseudomonas typographi]
MSHWFDKRVYWVIGATGALGRATVEALARQGATVIASSRSVTTAHFSGWPSVFSWPLDVGDSAAVDHVAAGIIDRFGRLDGLVTSSNVAAFGEFHALADEDWYRVLEAKWLGSVRPVRAVLPHLIAMGQGAIVLITGRGGIDPSPQHFIGSSVNAALDLLVQGLGRRYGPQGVRVNAVAPGPIASPRYQALQQASPQSIEPQTPLAGPGKPEDVASAVLYLLSDAAAFVNASGLYVDGGGKRYV